VILAIILLSLLAISLGYSTFNLLKKLETYEEQIEKSDEWILSTEVELRKILDAMEAIDSKGVFENDDEVGQTFLQLKKTINSIEKLL